MKKIKAVIVVPTIRENSIKRFLEEWEEEFFGDKRFAVSLIIVEDNPKKTFALDVGRRNIIHYSWEDIERDLREHSWIIPRRSDCVRSYGYLKAYRMKPDMIVTLDDDCYCLAQYKKKYARTQNDFLWRHWDKLNSGVGIVEKRWISTIKGLRPRGIPYRSHTNERKITNIVLNHGLWYNTPDFDGLTQLKASKATGLMDFGIEQVIPRYSYFPMCGMNVAWKPEATPALYFLLMGKQKDGTPWSMERFGDIWAGIFMKKISDHLGHSISSGDPIIWHDRASDPHVNFLKEKNGMKENELLWKAVDRVVLTGSDFRECYIELAEGLDMNGPYWKHLKKAMKIWAEMFASKGMTRRK